MANSIENRVPFLDNRFIDLLFSIYEEQLVHPMLTNVLKNRSASCLYEGKYILKQLSAQIYGRRFAFRRKQAVRITIDAYIKNPRFQNYLTELIIPEMKKRGMVNMNEFDKAYSHLKENSNMLLVWKAINMEAWMQLFYDGRNVLEV